MKVCFPITVKYNGTKYAPNTPFEANDKDVEELKAKGCWVVQEERTPVKLVKEVETEEVEAEEQVTPKKKTSKGAKKKEA